MLEKTTFIPAWLCAAMALFFAAPATAYIGPGSGLGAFGVLAGALAALGLAVVGFFWYPLKRWFARDNEAEATDVEEPEEPPLVDSQQGN